ncbi:MAG: energy transducer TonB [Flavobacteriales bacterium]
MAQATDPFHETETLPVFESCAHIQGDQNEQQICFSRFIMNHLMNELQWPEGLKENGKVFVELTFDAKGHLAEVNSLRSYDDLAKAEALRAVRTLPDPIRPGTVDGEAAQVTMVVPVMFTRN